jgi:hypothetical protein
VTCDVRDNANADAHGQCQEWRGEKSAKTNVNVDFPSLCRDLVKGSVLTGECPAEGLVGVCTRRPTVAERVVLHHYYAPTWTADMASAQCTGAGATWAAN